MAKKSQEKVPTPVGNTDVSFALFKVRLEGWRRTVDGENLCSGCWVKKLARIRIRCGGDLAVVEGFQKDSVNLADVAETLKAKDDYVVFCGNCKKEVSVMFDKI